MPQYEGFTVKIGYARVSTEDQSLSLQEDALREVGCDAVFSDQGVSGTDFSRPGLDAALKLLQSGDTLVVWRLDRLGRSLNKLIELVNRLGERSIGFHSITETINTSSPSGVLIFHMMGALAEFERSLISERTRAGIAAAKARGKIFGRKPALSYEQQIEAVKMLASEPINFVAKKFKVHPRTLKRIQIDALVHAKDGSTEPD